MLQIFKGIPPCSVYKRSEATLTNEPSVAFSIMSRKFKRRNMVRSSMTPPPSVRRCNVAQPSLALEENDVVLSCVPVEWCLVVFGGVWKYKILKEWREGTKQEI